MTRRALVLMAKAPLPGLVKTRLVREGALTAEQAALLAEAMLLDTIDCARVLPSTEFRIAFAPASERAWFQRCADGAVLEPQVDGDLGARITAAFQAAFEAGRAPVVMIGSDCPELRAEHVADAFTALEFHDLVLGPARDGGYYLIGLARPVPGLLDGVEWSTPRVLEQTLGRARERESSTALLTELADVDDRSDLDAFARSVAGGTRVGAHTRAALVALQRL